MDWIHVLAQAALAIIMPKARDRVQAHIELRDHVANNMLGKPKAQMLADTDGGIGLVYAYMALERAYWQEWADASSNFEEAANLLERVGRLPESLIMKGMQNWVDMIRLSEGDRLDRIEYEQFLAMGQKGQAATLYGLANYTFRYGWPEGNQSERRRINQALIGVLLIMEHTRYYWQELANQEEEESKKKEQAAA